MSQGRTTDVTYDHSILLLYFVYAFHRAHSSLSLSRPIGVTVDIPICICSIFGSIPLHESSEDSGRTNSYESKKSMPHQVLGKKEAALAYQAYIYAFITAASQNHPDQNWVVDPEHYGVSTYWFTVSKIVVQSFKISKDIKLSK